MKKQLLAVGVLFAFLGANAYEPTNYGTVVPGSPRITWSNPGVSGTIACDGGPKCYAYGIGEITGTVYGMIPGLEGEWIFGRAVVPPKNQEEANVIKRDLQQQSSMGNLQIKKN